MSQQELARRIGVSRQTINMIENDKYNPSLKLCINSILLHSIQRNQSLLSVNITLIIDSHFCKCQIYILIALNRVKQYRAHQKMSQQELARRIGVSRQTINMIENDKYNPYHTYFC
jgi:DNA-binding XRE family transcriptional regulator